MPEIITVKDGEYAIERWWDIYISCRPARCSRYSIHANVIPRYCINGHVHCPSLGLGLNIAWYCAGLPYFGGQPNPILAVYPIWVSKPSVTFCRVSGKIIWASYDAWGHSRTTNKHCKITTIHISTDQLWREARRQWPFHLNSERFQQFQYGIEKVPSSVALKEGLVIRCHSVGTVWIRKNDTKRLLALQ